MGIALYCEVCSEVCSDALVCVCVCVCRLETVYEIAGDFRPTTSGSTKRGKIKLWTEDGMCVLYVHTLMYIHTYIHSTVLSM